MNQCIWYISKYVSPPTKTSSSNRGFSIMRELAAMGYECIIITSDANHLADVPKLDTPHLIETVDGLQLCWIRTVKHTIAKSTNRILSWLDFEWKLWRLPKQQFSVPDVVIVSSLSLLTIINGLLLRSRYRCRLVFEIRDIWPLTITEEGGFSKWNPFVMILAVIEKFGYRNADVIVGTMPNLKEHVTNVLGFEKETYCIPMGVDTNLTINTEPLSADFINNYIPKNKFIIAYAGTIGITNALDIYFESAEAMANNQNIHFIVLGGGALLDSYVDKYGHLSNLTFVPRVPKTMVTPILELCDLLYFSVHVSKVWRYGQSLNKLIDYMLAGKPIVASYTGFPSMINEAKCGTFVPAGDQLALQKEFLRYADMDKSERQDMGRRGREWILKNRNYKQLARDYTSILFSDYPAE